MPAWNAEDSAHLKTSRENAGIDAYSFARSASISLAQLKELESSVPGEDQLFYSEQIKRHVGRSLLARLGVEPLVRIQPPPPEPIPVEVVVQVAAEVARVEPIVVHQNTPEIAAPELANTPSHWADRVFEKLPMAATTQGRMGWSVAFVVTLAASLIWANGQSKKPAAPPAQAVAQKEPAPVLAAVPSPSPELAASEAAASPVAAEETTQCDWKFKGKSLVVVPSEPLKAGNYVHVAADKNTIACVLDSQKKLTQITLKAGEKLSVSGAAPFLIYSPEFSTSRIYFQGKRIYIPDPTTTHLTLNEAKAG
ncbi:MAG: hypothetical protein RLZZ454_254 [Pseudomonadota bacterium]